MVVQMRHLPLEDGRRYTSYTRDNGEMVVMWPTRHADPMWAFAEVASVLGGRESKKRVVSATFTITKGRSDVTLHNPEWIEVVRLQGDPEVRRCVVRYDELWCCEVTWEWGLNKLQEPKHTLSVAFQPDSFDIHSLLDLIGATATWNAKEKISQALRFFFITDKLVKLPRGF